MTLVELFTQIADAIREKKDTTLLIKATDFPEEILSIETGGGGSEENYIHTNFYDLFFDGNYGYFPPEFCEQLMKGTYVLEEV